MQETTLCTHLDSQCPAVSFTENQDCTRIVVATENCLKTHVHAVDFNN